MLQLFRKINKEFSKSSIIVLFLLINTLPGHGASHHPQEFLKTIQGSNDEGRQIYHHFCANCHAKKPIISVGAPRIGMVSDWKFRMKCGTESLIKHTYEGLNAMPARGGCFECSDEQLILAIEEMLPKPFKKELFNDLKDYKKIK